MERGGDRQPGQPPRTSGQNVRKCRGLSKSRETKTATRFRIAALDGDLYGNPITDTANGVYVVYRLRVYAKSLPYSADVAMYRVNGNIY